MEADSKRTPPIDPTHVGRTEPLAIAIKRLGVPTEGVVWVVREPDVSMVAKLRCRDVIEFESVLWHDDSWMIDEGANWIVAGMHERNASWIHFSPR